jgi:hypothetical protein
VRLWPCSGAALQLLQNLDSGEKHFRSNLFWLADFNPPLDSLSQVYTPVYPEGKR